MRRLALLAFIWGWSFLFIKVAVGGMTPTTVAAVRIALGAAVLLAVVRLKGLRLPAGRTAWRHFAVTGLFGSALPFSMLAWGEERITSALTSVLNASTPLFTALLGAILLGERLRRPQQVGLVIGMAGVAVAGGVGGRDLADSSAAGAAAAVLAGACYGIGFAYMKRHLMGLPAEVAAAGQLVVATCVLAPFAVVTTATEGIDLAPHRVLAIGLLGVVGTGVAYVLNYRIVADIGPTKASLVTYLIPVVAVTVGVVVLDEPFRFRILAGGALIVAGIALVHRRLRLPFGRRPTPAGAGTALALLVVLGLVATLAACGSDGGVESGTSSTTTGDSMTVPLPPSPCAAVVTEPMDPGSGVHVLPGAPEPDYLTDPPTSGPHLSGPSPEGVLAAPLDRPTQVRLLEGGGVLVQHEGLDGAARAELESLAAGGAVVAPGTDLPAPVVATAWLTKQTCTAVDLDVLRRFVTDHAGGGPESAGQDH